MVFYKQPRVKAFLKKISKKLAKETVVEFKLEDIIGVAKNAIILSSQELKEICKYPKNKKKKEKFKKKKLIKNEIFANGMFFI